MRAGLKTSIHAAYAPAELRALMTASRLNNPEVRSNQIGLNVAHLAT